MGFADERASRDPSPFDREASRYEAWYETPRGRRASGAERALLDTLLAALPGIRSALDVGCGTGHFTRWLATRAIRPIGLDRSAAMLREFRRHRRDLPALRADASSLPVADGSVDLVLFVTTLEFLDDPARALSEAVRAARRGVIAVALNRFSVGALSRRVGPDASGALLASAHDLSSRRLRALVMMAAGARLVRLRSKFALLPAPLPPGPTFVPFADVVGVAAVLAEPGRIVGASDEASRREDHPTASWRQRSESLASGEATAP